MLIYKICPAAQWHDAVAAGRYGGSADDRRDGFIHFSTAPQLRATADKHFKGQRGLLLIEFDAAVLGDALKWEPANGPANGSASGPASGPARGSSRDGALFPHLYASLDTNAAMRVMPLSLGGDGLHRLPLEID